MPQLLCYRLQPAARLIRLMLAEYEIDIEIKEMRPWRRDTAYLEIDPAAEGPVLMIEDHAPIVGLTAVLMYVEENLSLTEPGRALMPATVEARAETRRLMDWVQFKLNDEVSRYVIEEKFVRRDTGGTPDPSVLRAAKANFNEHLHYFSFLFATRRWVAGDAMTLADFALAAHISALDYLGDVPWDDVPEVKSWYQRIKSRPAFRTLLNDRIGALPAAKHYADLDF